MPAIARRLFVNPSNDPSDTDTETTTGPVTTTVATATTATAMAFTTTNTDPSATTTSTAEGVLGGLSSILESILPTASTGIAGSTSAAPTSVISSAAVTLAPTTTLSSTPAHTATSTSTASNAAASASSASAAASPNTISGSKIAAAVVGSLAGISFLCMIVAFFLRRWNRRRSRESISFLPADFRASAMIALAIPRDEEQKVNAAYGYTAPATPAHRPIYTEEHPYQQQQHPHYGYTSDTQQVAYSYQEKQTAPGAHHPPALQPGYHENQNEAFGGM